MAWSVSQDGTSTCLFAKLVAVEMPILGKVRGTNVVTCRGEILISRFESWVPHHTYGELA